MAYEKELTQAIIEVQLTQNRILGIIDKMGKRIDTLEVAVGKIALKNGIVKQELFIAN